MTPIEKTLAYELGHGSWVGPTDEFRVGMHTPAGPRWFANGSNDDVEFYNEAMLSLGEVMAAEWERTATLEMKARRERVARVIVERTRLLMDLHIYRANDSAEFIRETRRLVEEAKR